MNRTDLHQLAEARIAEAKILLDAGQWPGAYYLAGYAVECALKACIAKMTKSEDFPDKDLVLASWTHKLLNLVETAELKTIRETECQANPVLSSNWQTAKDWKESSRYEFKSEADAKALFAAITDPTNGVLPWIKLRW